MTFIPSHFQQNYKLMFIPLLLALAVTICILLSVKHPIYYPSPAHREIIDRIRTSTFTTNEVKKNHTAYVPPKKAKSRGDEVIYNLLSNTTRTLIAMEIRARRLEDNIRKVREKTRSLLWKNNDKSLWRILFKNISRSVAIRHQYHEHNGLERILDGRRDRKVYNKKEYYDNKFETIKGNEFIDSEDYENLTT